LNDHKPVDFDSVESRRSSASMRRLTPARRLYYSLGLPLLRLINWALLKSYRFQPVIGAEHAEALLQANTVSAPCYWHQHHVLCSAYMRKWLRRGYKLCFLISGSVDGDVPERIARSWGAEVIRGSANQSGALALRDQQRMLRSGYSIVTTADGPRGPKYEFKAGTMLMARIAGVPIVPIACAADRAWYLNRWDDFMIPKPFARVVVAVGEPYLVSREVKLDEMEPHRLNVQRRVMSLMEKCEEALGNDSGNTA
jgi:lysophospholipid acyltransferase (LPLAT)-like uncharacterized protein